MQPLTVIMYHYVRDLEGSRYPAIKGLETTLFLEQLDHLAAHYVFVRIEDVLAAARGEKRLPFNAVLLTFDDGYIDHYDTVFPILKTRGIQGAFYPPAQAVTEHVVLDVNKIHFILASTTDMGRLKTDIFHQLDGLRETYGLRSNEYYYDKLAHPNRFDTAEVIFAKRLLQVELPQEVRGRILDALFAQYVGQEEAVFSRELYMNPTQLREMLDAGMHVGVHGYRHDWLGALPPEQQRKEIGLSVEFLGSLGINRDCWTICYPYGSYNDTLLDQLRTSGCRLGFTTEVDIADLTRHSPLTLPRLDTNDFPKQAGAAPGKWRQSQTEPTG